MSELSRSCQERVRADRHATSYPLIVVGAVGFHYSSAVVARPAEPVMYGIPLAFVDRVGAPVAQRAARPASGAGQRRDAPRSRSASSSLASAVQSRQHGWVWCRCGSPNNARVLDASRRQAGRSSQRSVSASAARELVAVAVIVVAAGLALA